MNDKNPLISLGKALHSEDDITQVNREYIKLMLDENAAVTCVNRSAGKKRVMPFKALYENNDRFWQQKGGWEYFVEEEEFSRLKEKAGLNQWEARPELTIEAVSTPPASEAKTMEQGYGSEAEAIFAMPLPEKIKRIEESAERLSELVTKKVKDPEAVTEALVETTKDAAMINHAALLEAMHVSDEEAKNLTRGVVASTVEMVKASTQLISDDILNDDLMHTLVEKSNGTIVQHMTRTYLTGVSFLAYYNKLVTTSSIINKLRVSFSGRYKKFYHHLLPHIDIDDLSLEHVFYKGMGAFTPEDFFQWAVGFLIHDIGKASAVEYHEGESAYDRDIVTEHVKLGFTSVMNKTNYPREAGLITGYHHEYYGDGSGYGYFRPYLEQYKRSNPNAKQDYCITFEVAPMLDCQAISYFPAKVLEIIDVYDSVTDPNRIYKKAMDTEEALSMMREQFIIKSRKIDPIIFDIFEAFIRRKK